MAETGAFLERLNMERQDKQDETDDAGLFFDTTESSGYFVFPSRILIHPFR
jgi:hypothetical protein